MLRVSGKCRDRSDSWRRGHRKQREIRVRVVDDQVIHRVRVREIAGSLLFVAKPDQIDGLVEGDLGDALGPTEIRDALSLEIIRPS